MAWKKLNTEVTKASGKNGHGEDLKRRKYFLSCPKIAFKGRKIAVIGRKTQLLIGLKQSS